jgi:hypothetical protein
MKEILTTDLEILILEEDLKSVLDLISLPSEARQILTGVLKKITSLKEQ